ncbi:hypothetical protein [Methylobacterium oxalidis]|uniref:Uncharacterized protein n=1 Tax=Methylobacterium oxalidis TaxID=944322 RepID=A0A512IZI8_9HYPH|nr:hypothetical protein [Methylobacterium oxalidis]GEP03126.1 hypothetical protein MOX02_11640 [Methylobacterium oxalidis]GJE31713.1 hypothetical protein LDDCCGHA_1893 [Methylobacterium oxalidis]GLS67385.1 hypothetical protein GCM10007888_57690 [Methylobacterium oxalidis]
MLDRRSGPAYPGREWERRRHRGRPRARTIRVSAIRAHECGRRGRPEERLLSAPGPALRRRNAFRFGLIRPESGPGGLECLVWELTGDGAIIEIEPEAFAPDGFRLESPDLSLDETCRVTHREGRKLTVRFAG